MATSEVRCENCAEMRREAAEAVLTIERLNTELLDTRRERDELEKILDDFYAMMRRYYNTDTSSSSEEETEP